jgi:hypothetical protein
MRSIFLFLAVLIAGCAQSGQRRDGDTPVVIEKPRLSERIRTHKQDRDQQQAAEDTTAETSIGSMVIR